MDHNIHIYRLFDIGLGSQTNDPRIEVKIELEKSITRYIVPTKLIQRLVNSLKCSNLIKLI